MAVKNGSTVVAIPYLYDFELEYATKYDTSWYRSKGIQEGMNFVSYMLNKKWALEEEFNNHLMRFHQVTVSSIFYIYKSLTF